MTDKFLQIVDQAQERKREFDLSVEFVKDSLSESVAVANRDLRDVKFASEVKGTGWLKGSLSYPWVIICTIIPAIVDGII